MIYNIIQANANENFRCHSILCRLIIDFRYLKSSEFDFNIDLVDLTLFIVKSIISLLFLLFFIVVEESVVKSKLNFSV